MNVLQELQSSGAFAELIELKDFDHFDIISELTDPNHPIHQVGFKFSDVAYIKKIVLPEFFVSENFHKGKMKEAYTPGIFCRAAVIHCHLQSYHCECEFSVSFSLDSNSHPASSTNHILHHFLYIE